MNPRTHPRGAAPDFALPKPNPNSERMTDGLWWLVCMRDLLEPDSDNGGTVAAKPGYHSWGSRLPDHGQGNSKTDHSIRRAPDRTGAWWKTKTSAHDWTFRSAQRGDYRIITIYTKRLIHAMRDSDDPRPDDVYAYTLGQVDNDRVVEGYNEYTDDDETSGDTTHNWHRHDSFRRNIIGSFWAMWKALTVDMGWTVAEWQQSIGQGGSNGGTTVKMVKIEGELPELKKGMSDPITPGGTWWISRAQKLMNLEGDGIYGDDTKAGVKKLMADHSDNRSSSDGSKIGLPEWRRLFGIW